MLSAGSFLVVQLLLTILLVALLWSLRARLRAQVRESVREGRKVTAENVALQAEIDERHKAEQALRESESRYRAVVEDQEELICRFRPDATITFVNQAYCRYFGCTRERLIGRSFMELIPAPDQGLMRQHLDTFTAERPLAVVEHRVTLPDGEVRWQQWTDRAIFDEAGRLEEFQSVGHDISERKRAEEALRESEERYRALASAGATVVWQATADGKAVFATPSWQELTGQTDDEMRGIGWLDAIHPDDRAQPFSVWKAAAAGKCAYESELRVRTRDGRYRHFQTRGVPILAADGTVREWIGANTDITERKEAEDALRREQSRHQLATAAGGVGVWDLDLETGEMYIDPQLKAILGFEDHEIRNHLDDWILRVHPGDLERMKADVVVHRSGARQQYEDEHRMLHKDGSIRWFLARGRMVGGPGDRPRLMGTDTDVTARKEAAEALREVQARHQAILSAVPDLMFVMDKNGVYIDYHTQDAAALLIPPDQFLGRNVREIFPTELAGRMARCLEDVVRSGQPSTMEYDLPVRGVITHWEARIVPCDTDKVLSIVRDVTDRKRAERETRELRDELAHVGRVTSLGALTGSLAHEINQPLASIMANAQAAMRLITVSPPDLGELRETLADIVEDDRRAGNVLRRLRALLTNAVPETKPLDIKSTLEEILGLLHSDSVMRGLSLEVRLAEDLPPVRGDRVQLQQVALNLLINAFDAVQDLDVDRRRVILEAGVQEEQVVVSVADHGPGVPADRLSRIFEPFYTTKPEGMGMGLPICQTIANAHGGIVVATPNSGRGMTFSLRLPIAPGSPGTAAHPKERVAEV